MKKARVKICGITSKYDLITVVDAGTDAVGFIVDVPSSPRNITLKSAEKLMKLVPIFVDTILVTVPENLDSLKKIYKQLQPDGVQIYGKKYQDAQIIRKYLPYTKLIKAIHLQPDNVDESSFKFSSFDAVLIDSYVEGKYGGTGKVNDWKLSKIIRNKLDPTPLILAGGLTPNNVEKAIHIVNPYAVDVSSGVEASPGIKDPKKVIEFVQNAKKVSF